YLDSAVAEGGTFAAGGGRRTIRDTGFFIEPTVIAGLDNNAKVAREEIFGPVLTVIAHDGDDDAVRASPRGCGSAPSTSTAASGTPPTCRSADTSNPASAGRWGSPVSRNISKPKPLPQGSSRVECGVVSRVDAKTAS